MDRRLTPFSGQIARDTLRGMIPAGTYTPGVGARVGAGLVDLCDSPGGTRDRQLVLGERVVVIDRRATHSFVQADRDGYCGWISTIALGPEAPVTHRVHTRASHLYPAPDLKLRETAALPHGAMLLVLGTTGDFLRTSMGYVPAAHLRALDDPEDDPVAVARRFLGTPYLWGGNSGAGIDCSGLVQAACLACAIPCPADSDQQMAGLGHPLPMSKTPSHGDVIFWKGHVGLIEQSGSLIHATAYQMTTRAEPLAEATARIAATGGGPVLAVRRLRTKGTAANPFGGA